MLDWGEGYVHGKGYTAFLVMKFSDMIQRRSSQPLPSLSNHPCILHHSYSTLKVRLPTTLSLLEACLGVRGSSGAVSESLASWLVVFCDFPSFA
jgi:hypothetical protein